MLRLVFAVLHLFCQSLFLGVGCSIPVFETVRSDHAKNGLADYKSAKSSQITARHSQVFFALKADLTFGKRSTSREAVLSLSQALFKSSVEVGLLDGSIVKQSLTNCLAMSDTPVQYSAYVSASTWSPRGAWSGECYLSGTKLGRNDSGHTGSNL
jgi:hypothetical protein